MLSLLLLTALVATAAAQNASFSEVIAVVLVQRNGDRTSAVSGEGQLTTLGMNQAYEVGAYFRNEYLEQSSTDYVHGVDTDYLSNQQIYAAAPYVAREAG
jgi:hypothetical protein